MGREEFIKQIDLFVSHLESIISNSEIGEVGFNIAKNQLNALLLTKYGLIYNPSIILKIGSPENEIIPEYSFKPEKYYSKKLNDSQKDAVVKALNMNDVLVVQGPPGTGKTTVISEMIMQLKHKNPAARFMVTSASHLAVDNVIECLSKENYTLSMIRIKENEKRKEIENYEIETHLDKYFESFNGPVELKNSLEEYFERNQKRVLKSISKNFDLVAITLNAIVGTRFDLTKPFDYVIIDEVAKSTLPEICSCLIYAKKVILIGDNKQLTPIIKNDNIEDEEETKYLAENSYIEYLFTHIHESSRAFLNKQFRMSNNIGSFVSDEFYQNPKLLNGRDEPNKNGLNYITYIPKSKINAASQTNDTEADIIESIISQLPKEKEIAIISPYKKQVTYLQKRFKDRGFKIGTIDSFQGQGVDIVLCSISRNDGSTYFISNPNRMNVAISRAKEQFWLIGDKKYLEKIPLFHHYFEYQKDGESLVNGYFYDYATIKKAKVRL